MRKLALVASIALAVALFPALVRGGPDEARELAGGLKRGVVVSELTAVMPRGSRERAIFAEVRAGGEVGEEIESAERP
jgi:hypothetical protein